MSDSIIPQLILEFYIDDLSIMYKSLYRLSMWEIDSQKLERGVRMKKDWRRVLSSVLGVTTAFTTLFQAGNFASIEAQAADVKVDKTVKLSPANASVFNDTDGDGFGEFQGFGTSL